jgi:membrane protease YdiL (CAAX protease family)
LPLRFDYNIVDDGIRCVKAYKKLLLFIVVALAAAALLSPWIFMLAKTFAAGRRGPAFEQSFAGLFIAAGSALLLATPSLLRLQLLREAGIVANDRANAVYGFVLAVASMALLGFVMYLSGALAPGVSDPLPSVLRSLGKALVTATMVGILEELFFRGILFRGLLEDSRPAIAFAAANLFYAASHFFKPPESFIVGGIDPFAGFRFVALCLAPFLDPLAILPGLTGLFILGAVLSYALVRTGTLHLSIGLHAGWIFGIKALPLFGDFSREDLGWLFGAKPKIVSGVVTWAGILLVGAIVHFMTRHRSS